MVPILDVPPAAVEPPVARAPPLGRAPPIVFEDPPPLVACVPPRPEDPPNELSPPVEAAPPIALVPPVKVLLLAVPPQLTRDANVKKTKQANLAMTLAQLCAHWVRVAILGTAYRSTDSVVSMYRAKLARLVVQS